MNVEFENDEIFLLSKKEYKKYQRLIPTINDWWWLQSPGRYSYITAYVYRGGGVGDLGRSVSNDDGGVRPALQISTQESPNLKPGEQFEKYHNTWIYLADNIAISKDIIANHRFDIYRNNYKSSEIRTRLLNWLKNKKGE